MVETKRGVLEKTVVNSKSWSVVDVLAMAVIVLLAASLMAMKVIRVRQHARGETCENNLKQIGLALHNYHSAYKVFPMGAGGTDNGDQDDPLGGNAGRLSALVGLSPFMEHQALWEQISNPLRMGDTTFPPMGPVPWYDAQKYPPWGQRPSTLVCPADPDAKKFPLGSCYVLNYGDGILQVGASAGDPLGRRMNALMMIRRATQRGVFHQQRVIRFRDVLDGLSNTLLFSESQLGGKLVSRNVRDLASDPSQTITAFGEGESWPLGREARWCDGSLRSSGFQAILPPNSPSATSDEGEHTAVMSASSHHGDGAHVVMCDGAVFFVTEEIDAGDPKSPSVAIGKARDGRPYAPPGSKSPYGIWGGLGSRASGEAISEAFRDNDAVTPPRRTRPPAEIEAIKRKPIRTWTAANGTSTLKGWLVECSPSGRIQLLSEQGETKHLKLSQLSSKDAYFIVKEQVETKLSSRRVLLEQMKEAVAMLEKKQFSEFISQFVDASDMDVRAMGALSESIFRQRGILIFSLDNAIADLEAQRPETIRFDESGQQVALGRRGGLPMVLRFDDGRWKLISGSTRGF